uniref:RPGRIP1 C-terminal domain-containing protein n=1 Tax=Erpetoichthys calabaricus TaxID=27687 RepID=A0A8C4RSH9_ERPCA
EQEALRLKEDVSSLQQKITFITSVRAEELIAISQNWDVQFHDSSFSHSSLQECDMSVEALSETLMQIKVRSEPAAVARTLRDLQVSHAETVLELEKTRDMLILQHKINKDYQVSLKTMDTILLWCHLFIMTVSLFVVGRLLFFLCTYWYGPSLGNFALQGLEGQPAGSIQVALRWKFPYTPPENLTKWPAGDQSKPREEFVPLTERVPVAKPRVSSAIGRLIKGKKVCTVDILSLTSSLVGQQSERLRVEILSLTIVPESRVALDEEIQQLYVEYRIFGVPLETTETPISLRKPTQGEEIHYNFTRVIYVDKAENFAVRQYLYTMLEGKDPNKGRLKFTVVSEPVEEEHEECQDVGYAYLDLKAVLLSGSDVVEQQLDGEGQSLYIRN